MIKKLEKKQDARLHKIFDLEDFRTQNDEDEKDMNKIYNVQFFSVHKTQTERSENLVRYYEDSFFSQEAADIYDQYEARFLNFYSYLYDTTEVYAKLFGDEGPISTYINFTNKDTYLSHVLLSIREQLFLKIVLPEYHAIIDGGFDLTHMLRVKKDHPDGLKKITKIINDNGLYILD